MVFVLLQDKAQNFVFLNLNIEIISWTNEDIPFEYKNINATKVMVVVFNVTFNNISALSWRLNPTNIQC
jgi:hypothetical protein